MQNVLGRSCASMSFLGLLMKAINVTGTLFLTVLEV